MASESPDELKAAFYEYLQMRDVGSHPLEKMLILAINEVKNVAQEYKDDDDWCAQLMNDVDRTMGDEVVDMMRSFLNFDNSMSYAPLSPPYGRSSPDYSSPSYANKPVEMWATELTRKRKVTELDCEKEIAMMQVKEWLAIVNELSSRVQVMNRAFSPEMTALFVAPSVSCASGSSRKNRRFS